MATWFVVAMVWTGVASAAELRWEGSACDERARVAADVERSLGHTLESVETADFEVSVSRAPGKWTMTLVAVDRQTGERRARTIEGATCQDAAAALAVAISIAIRAAEYEPTDDSVDAEPQTSAPAPPTQPAPAPAEPPRKPKSVPHAERELFGFAMASALVDVGTLPSAAPGIMAGVGAAWRFLTASIGGAVLLPERRSVASGGGGGEFQLAFGTVRICAEQSGTGVKPFACAGLELGSLSGRGVDIARPRSGSTPWFAAAVAVGGKIGLSKKFAATAQFGAAVPFDRRQFAFGDDVLIFEPAAVAARAALGLDFRF